MLYYIRTLYLFCCFGCAGVFFLFLFLGGGGVGEDKSHGS